MDKVKVTHGSTEYGYLRLPDALFVTYLPMEKSNTEEDVCSVQL